MKKILRQVKRIEKVAYPRHMQQLSWVRNMKDLAEYMECELSEVLVFLGDNWYMLVANKPEEVEIVDFASTGKVGLKMFGVFKTIAEIATGKYIIMDARETTSYPLVMRLIERYGGEVVEDDAWDWDGETMHSLAIAF